MRSVEGDLDPGRGSVALGPHCVPGDLVGSGTEALALLALHDQGYTTGVGDVLNPGPVTGDRTPIGADGCVPVPGASGQQYQGYQKYSHVFSGGV